MAESTYPNAWNQQWNERYTLLMGRRYPMFTEGWFARRFHCHATSLFTLFFFIHYFCILLCDEFIWEIWLISETWLDCSKLTYNTCNSTNKGSKNWSITFKGHKAVLLKAILAKTSNFWPIGPIELKFWHLILIMECLKISLRRSHGSTFGLLWWP